MRECHKNEETKREGTNRERKRIIQRERERDGKPVSITVSEE